MTRLKPSLFLERLIVTKDGKGVYDQRFQLGPNIIRGENGSGKSTIADFIFHSLGGELTSWRNAALRCDFTFAQVLINGEPATLRREVSPQRQRPMSVFWGDLEEARQEGVEGWLAFPFASRGTKESFSEVLFRALDLPEVFRSETGARITMHQLLRLLYVDQITPFNELFVSEDFDSSVVREAVGNLLLGIYDERLYDSKLRLRDLTTELREINEELRGIRTVLGESDTKLEPALLEAEITSCKSERQGLESQLNELLTEEEDGGDETDVEATKELRSKLREQQREVRRLMERLEELDYQLEDSGDFIESLEGRLTALNDSDVAQKALGTAVFAFCPACYGPLDELDTGVCALCKRPYEGERSPNVLRLRHELSVQLRESRTLQSERVEERDRLLKLLPEAESKLERLRVFLDQLLSVEVTRAEQRRSLLHRKIGYLDRQIEDLGERLRLARAVKDLEERRGQITSDIERLKDEIEARQQRAQKRMQSVTDRISSITVELLRNDLPRERAFEAAKWVTFDFSRNEIAVDGRTNFSASSMVYLKNAFHLALLLTSLEEAYTNHPRFALLDNVEDKGMEPERSHNFQELVVLRSEESEVEHQVIMTSSMISPELEDSDFVVGPHYTHERRTLEF